MLPRMNYFILASFRDRDVDTRPRYRNSITRSCNISCVFMVWIFDLLFPYHAMFAHDAIVIPMWPEWFILHESYQLTGSDKIPETLGMLVSSYRTIHILHCICAIVDDDGYHTNVRLYDIAIARNRAYVDVIHTWSGHAPLLTTSKFTLVQLLLYMVID